MRARNSTPAIWARRGALLCLSLSALVVASCQDNPAPLEPAAAISTDSGADTPSPSATDPTPPPGEATRVVLTPDDTVEIGSLGETIALAARAYDRSEEVATRVKWWIGGSGRTAQLSSTDRICTSPCSMGVTARAVGLTKVIIHEYRKGSTARTDTTWINVTGTGSTPSRPAPGVTLKAVVVTPGTAQLSAGAKHQFSAVGLMSDGTTAPLSSVGWTATGGTISQGLYTAGSTAGTYRVIGTSDGKADTSAVTIAVEPVPPPSAPSGPSGVVAGCPTSGYTRLVNVSTASQLASALSGAQPGDQIRLAAGTYHGQTSLSRAGTSTRWITLCGMPGTWPVLKGGRFRLDGAFITVTGLVFEGPNDNDVNVYMAGPHDIRFIGNEVRNSDWHAGLSVEDSYNVTIAYNYFHHNGGASGEIDHALYYRRQATTASTRNYIVNNLITTSVGRGISMHDNGGSPINYTTVAHNTIVRNGSTGILLALEGGHGNIVANNIVADNGLRYDYKQIRWKHGEAKVLNNIVWSPTASRSGMEPLGDGSTASGNLLVNPLFVSPTSDWHLQAGSPAIGLGLSGYATDDFEDKSRDGAPDAGAFER